MVKVMNDLHLFSTNQSAQLFQEAESFIPGGVTANIKYFDPYPIFMKEGKGSRLIDVDDNEYVDYSLCYGALMTGHGDERVKAATVKQVEQSGTVIFGTPHELEITMAKKLTSHYPSIDQVRFSNSGTEAVLLAIRLAIAYTKKEKIAKFEGHYHGGLNELLISVNPSAQQAGDCHAPTPVIESSGLTDEDKSNTIILPFNDLESTEILLRHHADELACVILEPIQGGFIPAELKFMKQLRKLTEELGILLIFDEIKTGFRSALGGAQSVYNIYPDLTTLGKVLGGGFPIGAVGGKREIMMLSAANAKGDVFAVGSDSEATTKVVFHSGTYNGHPVALAAGLETIRILEDKHTLTHVHEITLLLREKLEALYARYNIQMKTVGMGSIFNIIIIDQSVKNYRDMWRANIALRQQVDQELLHLGVYVKPLNRYSLSTAHTLEDVIHTVKAHEIAINNLKKAGKFN